MEYTQEIERIEDMMVSTGMTYSNVVNVKEYIPVKLPVSLDMTIERTNMFLDKVSKALTNEGLNHNVINCGIVDITGHVRKDVSMKSKLVYYDGMGAVAILIGEGWFLRIGNAEFSDHNITNRMFLEHIEVDSKSKGLGTYIMNTILDVCDQTGESLMCVPTDIVGKKGSLSDIRNWYTSLEFRKLKNNSVFYIYNPK
jgi:hypothetical protein